jgi:hypothetical protein
MSVPSLVLLLCLLALAWSGPAAPTVAAATIPGPAGIFAIGDTRTVPGEIAKFDFDFVAGYTLRVPWRRGTRPRNRRPTILPASTPRSKSSAREASA